MIYGLNTMIYGFLIGVVLQMLYQLRLNKFEWIRLFGSAIFSSLIFLPLFRFPNQEIRILIFVILWSWLVVEIFQQKLLPKIAKSIIVVQFLAILSTYYLYFQKFPNNMVIFMAILLLSVSIYIIVFYQTPLSHRTMSGLYIIFLGAVVSQVIMLYQMKGSQYYAVSLQKSSLLEAALMGMNFFYSLSMIAGLQQIVFDQQFFKRLIYEKFAITESIALPWLVMLLVAQSSTYFINFMYQFVDHFALMTFWLVVFPIFIQAAYQFHFSQKK